MYRTCQLLHADYQVFRVIFKLTVPPNMQFELSIHHRSLYDNGRIL